LSPSTTVPESSSEIPSASGSHDLANYVTVFLAIHTQRLSGTLETGTRRGWRRLYFLEGEVVGAASSFQQDALGRTLAAAGIVPKARIQWFEERLGPDEHIETALLASGALTAEQLTEHEQGRIKQSIATPLRSSSGSWRFEPAPGLEGAAIAPGIRPEVPTLAALWQGIQQHLAVDKVLPEVTDASLGPVVGTPALRAALPTMELEPPLSFLSEAVAAAITVEELFKQLPDRSGNLLKLVWMLERGGLLRRQDRPVDANLADRLTAMAEQAADPALLDRLLKHERNETEEPQIPEPATAQPHVAQAEAEPIRVHAQPAAIQIQAGPASPASVDEPSSSQPARSEPPAAPPISFSESFRSMLGDASAPQISIGRYASRGQSRTPASAVPTRPMSRRERPMTPNRVSSDHAKRLKRDFYGFLGLKPGCPIDVVDRRCKHMGQRWTSAQEMDLGEDEQRKLAQLLHGLQIVWQTLTNEERKLEYDRRLKDGHAPLVDEIRRALVGSDDAGGPSQGSDEAAAEADEGGSVEMARRLSSRGAYQAASRLLERLRRDEPSNPDVLAELGWAVWKLRGDSPGGENSPEDYIALALTFEPSHTPSLEYHARIAFERGDLDELQERLDRLLAADKQNTWALEVLSSDALGSASSRRSGGGLRFWRRKSD
jgi:tetratricopeptide (TPR) repeat protein